MLRGKVQYRLFLTVVFLISFFLPAWKATSFVIRAETNLDGTLKWKFKTEGGIDSSPAIGQDGTIYVGSDDGNLYAINPNGTLKWKFKTKSVVSSSPAIGPDGTIYVGSLDHNLYAINPNGTLKWKFETGYWIAFSLAIGQDGTIYVGSGDGNLYAINSDGTLKWKFKTGSAIGSSPAIGQDGTIYVGSRDHNLYAIYSNSHGLANSPWPMFHHDPMHTGRAGTVYSNPINNSTTTSSLHLNKGWNLKGSSHTIDIAALDKPEIVAVWKWADNKWLFWSPNPSLRDIAEQYGFDLITQINAYDGFWVKATNRVEVPIGTVIFQDNCSLGASAYRFWDLTYPDKYSPEMYYENGHYILVGSEHGVDGFIPTETENLDFSQFKEIKIKFKIRQLDGEYSDGGFGVLILTKDDKAFVIENNRDNDGTNHYEIYAGISQYDETTGKIQNGHQLYTKETNLWNIKTTWNVNISITDKKLIYSFKSEDGKYFYHDTIQIPFKISDIKALGLEISYHKVKYALYNFQIEAFH